MKAVLFDLDGVITSERIYWNCSGLALAKFRGERIPESAREKVKLAQRMLPDSITRGFKENGVNSNWDIAYASAILTRAGKDIGWFIKELKKRDMKGVAYLKLLDEIDLTEKHDRDGGSWGDAHKRFQACYYDLEDTDEPIIPLPKIKKALEELKSMGLKLGIVSGRPLREARRPLEKWGLWGYFDKNMIITDDDIVEQEKKSGKHMGKPDPWPVLYAIFKNQEALGECLDPQDGYMNVKTSCGEGKPADAKINGDYILVGDSVADVLSAKNAGIKVICVKTGITNEKTLREAGADVIVSDITKVPKKIRELDFS